MRAGIAFLEFEFLEGALFGGGSMQCSTARQNEAQSESSLLVVPEFQSFDSSICNNFVPQSYLVKKALSLEATIYVAVKATEISQ